MNTKQRSTYYTAVGHFRRKTGADGKSYPVILVNQEEHRVDIQEMAVWTILNWWFLHLDQIEAKYGQMARELPPPPRMLEVCLNRLEVRGLVARGGGDNDFEALYDLLGGLYVVPISESLPLRVAAFAKLVLDGVPFAKARQLFERDKPNAREAQVMALSRQALLSTAELIKCAEGGITDVSTVDKLMAALVDDDYTNSDSLPFEMLRSEQRIPVTIAVANLYLRKQIIFERV